MSRAILLLAAAGAAGAVLAAGCGNEPEGPETAAPLEPATIRAVGPAPMAREVSRRPVFRWKLPPHLAQPTLVTFVLAEAGAGDEPATDEAAHRRIATATGLADAGPESINLWDPPAGCVLTGEVEDMPQLAPDTWYRWTVRAVAPGEAGHADFYFRTRAEPAVPEG